jgi:hypothetical protein
MKKLKSCSSCSRGIHMSINKDILCRINGVVTQDFVCTRYREIKDAKPESGQKYKCVDCEFFIQDRVGPEVPANSGFCQLFTVRYYNGKTKNACSKFNKKVERIVS